MASLINLSSLGYSLAAAGYLVLTILLATSWRGRLQGGVLLAAATLSVVWTALVAYHAAFVQTNFEWVFVVELVRDGLWLLFLLRLLAPVEMGQAWRVPSKLRVIGAVFIALWLLLSTLHLLAWSNGGNLASILDYDPRLLGHVLVVIIGLALVEQLFRNTQPEQRWAIKYLCLGLGGLFAYDFFLYSDALLFGRLDKELWAARGYIQLLVVPLIAISAARNPEWSLEVFVSRGVVFHTAAMVAAGSYLMAMAAGGYLIRYWGGDWGVVGQVIFLVGAVLVLLVLMFSDQIRSRFKVFLSKHFFNYKYDYRHEWLSFIGALSSEEVGPSLRLRVIQALASIVDSPSGGLWLKESGRERYFLATDWNASLSSATLEGSDPLLSLMREREWLIDLNEYRTDPNVYGGLQLPDWIAGLSKAWLLLPLFQNRELFGFVMLNLPRAPRQINWEDRDLLKTAAQQATSYLALAEASSELADARQFEAFNRLSAYVVHDLKNVVGQLSLVTANAVKFKNNQAFIDDAMVTVENAVAKMQRMLAQLRQGRELQHSATAIELLPVIDEVVQARAVARPVPKFAAANGGLRVVAEKDRLRAVIEHVVQNAQEATPDHGSVVVRLLSTADNAVVEIEDSGSGMDQQFIRERLFRPFDTTKGNAGMGIGAYECREFIRALGGDVEVTSKPGVGSRFRILIPLL